MTQLQATAIATTLGHGSYAWHSGGGIWLVLTNRPDGRLAVLSDEAGAVYESGAAFDLGEEPQQFHPFTN